jgi:hypothetical protein
MTVHNREAVMSRRAILVGVSIYHDKSLPELRAALNSLEALHGALVDSHLCGWSRDEIVLLENPSNQGRLAKQIRDLAEITRDVLLFYFVGHGKLTENGELSLLLVDSYSRDSDVTGLTYDRIRKAFKTSPASVKISILDCCYSGAALEALSPSDAESLTAIRGAFTLAACDTYESAHVVPLNQQDVEPTSFTKELTALIQEGIPNGEKYLTLNDICTRLPLRLREAGLPVPRSQGADSSGDFQLSLNATSSKKFLGIPSRGLAGEPGIGSISQISDRRALKLVRPVFQEADTADSFTDTPVAASIELSRTMQDIEEFLHFVDELASRTKDLSIGISGETSYIMLTVPRHVMADLHLNLRRIAEARESVPELQADALALLAASSSASRCLQQIGRLFEEFYQRGVDTDSLDAFTCELERLSETAQSMMEIHAFAPQHGPAD